MQFQIFVYQRLSFSGSISDEALKCLHNITSLGTVLLTCSLNYRGPIKLRLDWMNDCNMRNNSGGVLSVADDGFTIVSMFMITMNSKLEGSKFVCTTRVESKSVSQKELPHWTSAAVKTLCKHLV